MKLNELKIQKGDRFRLPSGNVVEVTDGQPTAGGIACKYLHKGPAGGASFTAGFLLRYGVAVCS